MSIANALMCLIWFVGLGAAIYFVFELVHHYRLHRYQRGWDRITTRWPKQGHTDHFFRDLKTWPED